MGRANPRGAITVVAIAALLFLAPGGNLAAAAPGRGAGGGLGGGRGGRGVSNGGHGGGGMAGHEHLGEGRGGGPGSRFRGHDFDHRRFHHDDDLGLFVYPYVPYYDDEPYGEPGYDPYCDEDSPSYDAHYCDALP
jgi:hypothetical protein